MQKTFFRVVSIILLANSYSSVMAEEVKPIISNNTITDLSQTIDLEYKISSAVKSNSEHIKIITKEDIEKEKEAVANFVLSLNLKEEDKTSLNKDLAGSQKITEILLLKDKYEQISNKNTEEELKKTEEIKMNISGFLDKEDQELWNQVEKIYKEDSSTIGLSEHVSKAKVFLGKKFDIEEFSLFRPGDSDGLGTGHGDGLAIDLMVPIGSEKGDKIANYLAENFRELNINYIIWEQKFYMDTNNIYGLGYNWNLMDDRGSITANHYDHIHISFKK